MTISLFRETRILLKGASEPVKLYKFTASVAGTYETSTLWTPPAGQIMYLAGVWFLDDVANTIRFADSSSATAGAIASADEYPELTLAAYQPWSDKLGAGVLPIVAVNKLWVKQSVASEMIIAGFMSTQLRVE